MSHNRFSERFARIPNRNPEAIKRLVLRRLAGVHMDSPIVDALDLQLNVGFTGNVDLPGSDAEVAQELLESLAELFARAAGGSAQPVYAC